MKQINKSSRISLGLKSGHGFDPIPNRPGEYQCNSLAVTGEPPPGSIYTRLVYSVHSDSGLEECVK